jgi:hypothetical protein
MSTNFTIPEILNKMKELITLCKINNNLYKNSKDEMMVKLRDHDPVFYNRHYRICKTIVHEEDLGDLLNMLYKLHEIKTNQATLEDKDKEISNTYNAKYVNPILNTKELIEERNKKIKDLEYSN